MLNIIIVYQPTPECNQLIHDIQRQMTDESLFIYMDKGVLLGYRIQSGKRVYIMTPDLKANVNIKTQYMMSLGKASGDHTLIMKATDKIGRSFLSKLRVNLTVQFRALDIKVGGSRQIRVINNLVESIDYRHSRVMGYSRSRPINNVKIRV